MPPLNTAFSKSGLAYFPDCAIYATYVLKSREPASHQRWRELAAELYALCAATDYSTVVILGVGFDLWASWGDSHRCGKPVGMGERGKLKTLSEAFGDSGGDLWFHIKSDGPAVPQKTQALIEGKLAGLIDP